MAGGGVRSGAVVGGGDVHEGGGVVGCHGNGGGIVGVGSGGGKAVAGGGDILDNGGQVGHDVNGKVTAGGGEGDDAVKWQSRAEVEAETAW
ncbi:hypothetical protein E2562_032894 [Oryza meyeriana var. granulata]|uniref:Uncharacterized protein n=1 Tax=Oryza meyeriana var. granulata TaxID=110450 RepID=A0A6G1F0P8_9ORYZ|nr:hypothetical protein E2562_032894 [Oryza meyeriana var. granulata]